MTMTLSPPSSRSSLKAIDEDSSVAPDSPVETVTSPSSFDDGDTSFACSEHQLSPTLPKLRWPDHFDRKRSSSPTAHDTQSPSGERGIDTISNGSDSSHSDSSVHESSSSSASEKNSSGSVQPKEMHHDSVMKQSLPCVSENISSATSSLFALPNIALAQSYFSLGFALQFIRTPLLVYSMVDLGASPSQLQLLFSAMEIPFYCKIAVAVLSDCVPVEGRRRKPYLFMGWFVFAIANLFFLLTPIRSTTSCYLAVLAQTVGLVLIDSMTDAMMLDRAAYEPTLTRGGLLVTGYILRFVGSMVGSMLGSVLYNKDEHSGWYLPFGVLLFMHVAIPLACYLPFAGYLVETGSRFERKSVGTHVVGVWKTLTASSVWEPIAFFGAFNALQVVNPVWSSLWTEVLQTQRLASWQSVAIPGITALLGMLLYKTWLFRTNWRTLFCASAVGAAVIGTLSIFGIVSGINRGDSQGVAMAVKFAFGGEVASHLFQTIQSMMTYVVLVHLCPVGMEATSFVLFTTITNGLSTGCSGLVQQVLSQLTGPSLDTQAMTSLTGLALSLLPLALWKWLPSNTDHMWKQSKISELKQRMQDAKVERRAGLAALRAMGSAYKYPQRSAPRYTPGTDSYSPKMQTHHTSHPATTLPYTSHHNRIETYIATTSR